MPTASLSLLPMLDPAFVETLLGLRTIVLRLLVLAANGAGFAGIMWLILAAPGFLR